MITKGNYQIAMATDRGMVRQVNEDSMTSFNSPNGHVVSVCDGMGGQAAGDVASQLTVSIIENILTDNTFATPEEAIQRSVMAANQGVLNRAAQNPDQQGMGSTCVMLIIKDGRVHAGWVGDSRIYYIAQGIIRQVSHDQSYVQQLVDSGVITAEEAAHHPQKNEITNCIGLETMTPPQLVSVPIMPEPGSVFLLCSDGLTGMVDEQVICQVVSNKQMPLQQRAERLVALANEAGGLDNVTVELVEFAREEPVYTDATQPMPKAAAAPAAAPASAPAATQAQSMAAPNAAPQQKGAAPARAEKQSGTAKWLVVLAIVLVLALGAAGAYFLLSGGKKSPKADMADEPETEVRRGRAESPTRNGVSSQPNKDNAPAARRGSEGRPTQAGRPAQYDMDDEPYMDEDDMNEDDDDLMYYFNEVDEPQPTQEDIDLIKNTTRPHREKQQ